MNRFRKTRLLKIENEGICYVISEEVWFELFRPRWSHNDINEKTRCGDMVDRYLSTKIRVNLVDHLRQNGFYGQTDDGRPRKHSGCVL